MEMLMYWILFAIGIVIVLNSAITMYIAIDAKYNNVESPIKWAVINYLFPIIGVILYLRKRKNILL